MPCYTLLEEEPKIFVSYKWTLKGVGGSSNLFFGKLFYCISGYYRSWSFQNFLRNWKILFLSEDIAISKSWLSQVNITKTSNKSNYLKMSFFDFKIYIISPTIFIQKPWNFIGMLSGAIQKILAHHIFFLFRRADLLTIMCFFSKNLKKST